MPTTDPSSPLGLSYTTDDPEETLAEQQLRDQLADIIHSNQEKAQQIQRHGATLDPRTVLMIRVNTLLDLLLEPPARLRFDVLFEARMANLLDTALSECRRRDLLGGTQPIPPQQPTPAQKLIIPGNHR